MPTHGVPSYRHHKPSGKAVVTLNDRDFYLGPWQSPESKSEYDRLIAEWIANGRMLPSDASATELTVAELGVGFLRHAASYYANDGETTSEYTCIKEAVRPLHELYSHTLVKEFGPLALKAVRQRMIDKGWCRHHINRQINRLRRMFKWGVENELIEANVLHALKAVAPLKRGHTEARETEAVRPVSDEHVNAVLPFVARQVAAMINLQRLTGARPGEVVQMRPCDMEMSGNVWIFRPGRHKTKYRGREREIYLGPQAQKVLAPFLDRPADAFCFSPAEAEADRNAARRRNRKVPMTPSQRSRATLKQPSRPKGDRYNVNAYRRAITYSVKKSGVPAWHPNQLRHNCATKTRKEHGLDAAQLILGHKQCDVTQVYADLDRAKVIEIVSRCG